MTHFKNRIISIVIFLISVILICGCESNKSNIDENLSEKYEVVLDYKLDHSISSIDSIFFLGEYAKAQRLYNLILPDYKSNNLLRSHILNQIISCQIATKKLNNLDSMTKIIESIGHFKNTVLEINFLRNKAHIKKLEGNKFAIYYFHNALNIAQTKYPNHSLKAEILFELSKYYRFYNVHIDSSMHYAKKSMQAIKPGIQRLTFQNHLVELHIINRDYYNGLSLVNSVLNDPYLKFNEQVEATKLKARLLRKLKKPKASEQVIKTIFATSDSLSAFQKYGLLEESAFNSIYQNDTVAFKACLENIKQLGYQQLSYRLNGYRNFTNKNYKAAIENYSKYLEHTNQFNHLDIVVIKESLYILTESYRHIKDFEMAKHYAFKSLVYDSRFRNSNFDWDIVINRELLNETYNFFNYNAFSSIVIASNENGKPNKNELAKILSLIGSLDQLVTDQVKVIDESAISEFRKIGRNIYNNGIKSCRMLYDITSDKQYLELMMHFIERSKSFILYKDLTAANDQLFMNVPAHIKKIELTLKSNLIAAKQLYKINNTHESLQHLRSLLDRQQEFFENIEHEFPAYYSAKFDQNTPHYAQIQNYSDSTKTTMLQYFWEDNLLYTIAILPNKPVQFNEISIDEFFLKNLDLFMKYVSDPSYGNVSENYDQLLESSKYLYEKLIPTNSQLTDKLVLVPDGPLHQLPFGALISDYDSMSNKQEYHLLNFLERENTLQYAYSLKTYFASRIKEKKSNCILAVSYSSSIPDEKSELKDLPHSYEEVMNLTSIMPDECNQILSGNQATKSNFVSSINNELDIIHLATHATSSTTNRNQNKIYFRTSTSDTSNFIYGHEILSYDINANLIVLSACESANGLNEVGEGTISLARAFIQAGAKNVVSSLWQQVDFSAQQIQTRFYSNLKKGYSVPKSLNEAKRHYLQNSNKINAHPSYWAGIISYGIE